MTEEATEASSGTESTDIVPTAETLALDSIEVAMGGLPLQQEPAEDTGEESNADEVQIEESTPTEVVEQQSEEVETDQKSDVLQVEINGELQEVPLDLQVGDYTLKELIEDRKGEAEIKRRFSELDKEKRDLDNFKTLSQKREQNFQEVVKLASEGKQFEAMLKTAELAGMSPVEYEKSIVEQALKVAEVWNEKTEEEREVFWAQKERDHAKQALEKKSQEDTTRSQQQELESLTVQLLQQEGVSQEEFAQAYNELKSNNLLDPIKDYTPAEQIKAIANYHKDIQLDSRVQEAIEKVAPKHPQKEKIGDLLFKVAEHSYSVQDIVDIATEYLNGVQAQPDENLSKGSAAPKADGPEKTASEGKEETLKSEVFDPFRSEIDPASFEDNF